MFKKILVANRGEVAVRIMRACKELGISSVGVYSEVDRKAFFSLYADEAYCIGPAPSRDSYLNIERILDVAKRTRAEAIHPGYGFLAENAEFARACESAGIQFIGPHSDAIAAMGSKLNARRLMEQAGIPVVPGTGPLRDEEQAHAEAERIGYPVMVKASAGGGGIGMSVVEEESDLHLALAMTRSSAASAFGDPTVYMEKYLRHPRHIEFQVMADAYGNIVHLGERECSIQRRHQKLLEETPSPVMTPELREEMGAAAIRAASAVDYVNAGTVEFIYAGGKYYFLEMNTRLQVEHPITEIVTGVDVVKEQIRIAAGERLSLRQEEIRQSGWAMECRINAEDPLANFAPTPGRIKGYRSPGGIGIRVDSGVHMNYKITPFYDSLISKLIIWGRDRAETIERARRALFEYVILGVVTNIPFLKAVVENPDFQSGDYSTHFIEEHPNLLADVARIKRERSLGGIFSGLQSSRGVAVAAAAVQAYLAAQGKG